MRTDRARNGLAAGVLVGLMAMAATAAAQERPQHVRGAIKTVADQSLTIDTREGKTVDVGLTEDSRILGLTEAKLSDIQPGTFVGAAARPRSGGGFVAQEILIFPEAMRGAGEGHYPWDLTPDGTMTNATVSTMVEAVDGNVLTLKLKDRSYTMQVPPDAPIVTIAPGDGSLLKPGAHVFINAKRQSDGVLRADAVIVGRDGVVPPM